MMKKYFTDGLIQIAIVLSLLRTDLQDYLNVIEYSREQSTVHEIILGSGTSAFTQTEHHSNWFSDLSTTVHPKNIDNYISGSVFRELHSLGRYQRFVHTNIHTYLVGEPPTVETGSTGDDNSNIVNNDNNDTHVNQVNNETSSDETNLFPGTELTKEDMDLIEVLWRQDIDMGVSKDTFNSTIRKELEKEENLESVKEKEENVKKEETSNTESTEHDTSITYVLDMETGELVPAPPGTAVPSTTQNSMEVEPQTQNEDPIPISFEEAIEILERESLSGSQSSSTSSSTTYSDQQGSGAMDVVADAEIDTLVQNISQLSGLSISRQTSIEARWNDVEGLIGHQNANLVSMTPNHSMELNTTMTTLENMTPQRNILLQNASLSASATQDISFNLTQNIGTATDILPLNLNDSQPLFNNNEDVLASLFPNASHIQLQNDTEPDSLLQDLLRGVDGDNFNQTGMIKLEDSDSAVGSMGSETDGINNLQDFGDSHSDLVSPFDGLEGATGGQESSTAVVNKHDPNTPRFSFSTIDWNHTEYNTNHSMSDNSTQSVYQDFASPSDVAHNHSYPLKPGQTPKEDKKQQKEIDRRITRSRDERRAKSMKLPISVEDIIHTPVEKFTELLSRHKLTDPQMQLVRDIRRRGKNKVAAQNCRKRKMEVIETLEESVTRMREERSTMAREKRGLEKQRDKIREMYSGLYRDVFRSLRDEHGQPYDPSQYTLQHTADGNVFLIPKSNTTNDDPQLKDNKKRKDRK